MKKNRLLQRICIGVIATIGFLALCFGAPSFTPDNRSGDLCPKCKSTDIGRFVYGRIFMDSVATEKVRSQKWILAGCTLSSKSPKYKCNSCSYEWGNHMDFINWLKAKD